MIEDESYITCLHEMSKAHSIGFIACVTSDRLLLTRLYPEQNMELRLPAVNRGALFYYCTRHGLMEAAVHQLMHE